MDLLKKNLLKEVSGLESLPKGAYNIRIDGKKYARQDSANIEIRTKNDKDGIDIIIKSSAQNESVHIPVILTENGLKDMVYNDFFIEDNAVVTIVAGCGIHNCDSTSEHNGIHTFYIGKNAKVKYIEKHYGEGDNMGKRILNPVTNVFIKENGQLEINTTQIKGVDETERITYAKLEDNATLIINEKVLTNNNQNAKTIFKVDLDGKNSSVKVTSRSVAENQSKQTFKSEINGNNLCFGHVECDAIIKDNARVQSTPEITANHIDANLVHEAAIGKIAGEQIIKLQTLGLSEQEAEEAIIAGFLK
ncbi:MAG: SufD family Fe-S cluster assembly protein [Clostridia bacterium]|nr:SufD family Fe-S cluster assembly protein [Clostridia bacterium]